MLAFLLGFVSKAQDVNVSINFSLSGTETEGSVTFSDVTDDYYVVAFPWPKAHRGLIMILEPGDALVEIFKGDKRVLKDHAPTAMEFLIGGTYEIVITMPNGTVWRYTLELEDGYKYLIGVSNVPPPPPPSQPVVTQPEPTPAAPPPPPPGPQPCSDAEFRNIITQLQNEPFPDTRLQLLSSIAKSHYFTVNQALEILSLFEFDEDKLKAAKTLYPSLVDPQDAYRLTSAFTFDDTKQKWLNWVNSQH